MNRLQLHAIWQAMMYAIIGLACLAFAGACLSPWWGELPGVREWWSAHR